jgi:hypothetical protein
MIKAHILAEAEWHDILQAVCEEVTQHSNGLRAEFEKKLSELPVASSQAFHGLTSPAAVRSSCGSTVLPKEEQSATFPVDKIRNLTPCNLYV